MVLNRYRNSICYVFAYTRWAFRISRRGCGQGFREQDLLSPTG